MSDHWDLYQTDIEGFRAIIVFDDGAGEELKRRDLPNLLRIQIELEEESGSGLPDDNEVHALNALEEQFEGLVSAAGGQYVGRVTVQSHRTFYYYVDFTSDRARSILEPVVTGCAYELGMKLEADAAHATYWRDLCPSSDERQMMSDMKVIYQLEEHGDDLMAPRRVDHYAYFTNRQQIDLFVNWARNEGFEVDRIMSPSCETPQHSVVLHHRCRPLPDEISAHTIALSETARSLGGEYDGWETALAKPVH